MTSVSERHNGSVQIPESDLFGTLTNICITAIWDNRSVFHAATFDYEGLGERHGNRVVGIGEKPFYDPSSESRTEYLDAN